MPEAINCYAKHPHSFIFYIWVNAVDWNFPTNQNSSIRVFFPGKMRIMTFFHTDFRYSYKSATMLSSHFVLFLLKLLILNKNDMCHDLGFLSSNVSGMNTSFVDQCRSRHYETVAVRSQCSYRWGVAGSWWEDTIEKDVKQEEKYTYKYPRNDIFLGFPCSILC